MRSKMILVMMLVLAGTVNAGGLFGGGGSSSGSTINLSNYSNPIYNGYSGDGATPSFTTGRTYLGETNIGGFTRGVKNTSFGANAGPGEASIVDVGGVPYMFTKGKGIWKSTDAEMKVWTLVTATCGAPFQGGTNLHAENDTNDDWIFTYVTKDQVTGVYYAIGNSGDYDGEGDMYMWSSTDALVWTAMNSGNPVLTHDANSGDAKWRIFNPAIAIVGNTIHLIFECRSAIGASWKLHYSHATKAALNFDANFVTTNIIPGTTGESWGGCAYFEYVPAKAAFVVVCTGENRRTTASGRPANDHIAAYYALASSNLDLSASWIPSMALITPAEPSNYQGVTLGYNQSDAHIYFTNSTNSSRYKFKSMLFYWNDQVSHWQAYSQMTLNDFYDYISSNGNYFPANLYVGGETVTGSLNIGGWQDVIIKRKAAGSAMTSAIMDVESSMNVFGNLNVGGVADSRLNKVTILKTDAYTNGVALNVSNTGADATVGYGIKSSSTGAGAWNCGGLFTATGATYNWGIMSTQPIVAGIALDGNGSPNCVPYDSALIQLNSATNLTDGYLLVTSQGVPRMLIGYNANGSGIEAGAGLADTHQILCTSNDTLLIASRTGSTSGISFNTTPASTSTLAMKLSSGGALCLPKGAITLGVGATAIEATKSFHVITGDGGGNTVATITGKSDGYVLRLLFVDNKVTITDTNAATADTVNLSAAFTSSANAVMTLISDGTKWFECSRSVN